MKVYFLAYNLMKNSTSDYFIALSNKLSEDGQVIVITSKIRETNIPLNADVQVLKWPSNRPSKWVDFIFLYKTAKTYKPDVMISIFGTVNLFLLVGFICGVKHRIAWIRSLSTQFSQKRLLVLRRSLIYKLATQVITNSNATKEDSIRFFGVNSIKILVLPNSVKDYSKSLVSIQVDHKKIVYVGRLHPTKGIDTLIRAFAILIGKGFKLHLEIIGRGDLKATLVNLCAGLSVQDSVHFLGEQPKEIVLEKYKSSYCTVIPSQSEAFGFTVIEAMSTETCVIGADNTGIKEIIVPDETGLLFETGNPNDLAEKIEVLLIDRDLRNRLAAAGYSRFRLLYDHNIAIQRDFDFFSTLI